MAKLTPIKSKPEATRCFTFEVKMLVQILGSDATKAQEALDAQGGYVTRRDVELVSSVAIYNGTEEQ